MESLTQLASGNHVYICTPQDFKVMQSMYHINNSYIQVDTHRGTQQTCILLMLFVCSYEKNYNKRENNEGDRFEYQGDFNFVSDRFLLCLSYGWKDTCSLVLMTKVYVNQISHN